MASQAPGGGNDPLGMLGQQLGVHPWLVVEALQIRLGRQRHEIAVADIVLGQQHHVVAAVLVPGRPVEARPGRDVGLDADDRVDARPVGRPVEIDRPVQHAMVGNGNGGLFQLGGPGSPHP